MVFLIFHAIHSPFIFNGYSIAAFLEIFAVIGVIFALVFWVMEKLGMKSSDESDIEAISDIMISELRRPWRFLLIPAEDGFFLLPLLYIGINPLSAAIASFLFAVAHYPVFPWRVCVPKGIAYFFVALFILPHGIWPVVVAHLLIDLFVIGLMLLEKVEGKPTWSRILKILRTE